MESERKIQKVEEFSQNLGWGGWISKTLQSSLMWSFNKIIQIPDNKPHLAQGKYVVIEAIEVYSLFLR